MKDERKVDSDLEIVGARVQGLSVTIGGIENDVAMLAGLVKELAKHTADIAEGIVSMTTPKPEDPQTWIVTIPEGDEYGVGQVDVLIMQFAGSTPTVAFRRERNHTWGRPYSTRVAP